MIRLRAVILAAAIVVLPALPAAAAPITLNFTGQWTFQDLPFEAPEFHAAMGIAGITYGTPLSLSFTLEPALIAPNSSNPGALSSGQFNVGALSYGIGGSSFGFAPSCVGLACSATAQFFAPLFGPTIASGGMTFYPNFIQFNTTVAFTLSSSLVTSLANASWSNASIFASFSRQAGAPFGASGDMGLSSLQFTSASIPEPGTISLALTALAAWGAARRFRPRV